MIFLVRLNLNRYAIKTLPMKKTFFMLLCFAIFSSCESDGEIVGGPGEDSFFRITDFTISGNPTDLNNDDVLNSNMLFEFSNYFNNTYDLEIKARKNSSLLSFYLPKQNVAFDYLCCPDGFVEFTKGGFTVSIVKDQDSISNYYIDNENKINSFIKSGENTYVLTLEKEYLNFDTNLFLKRIFEIKYERVD